MRAKEFITENDAPKVKLEISYTNYSHGQHDGYIIARNEEGLGMGYLDFSIYEGEALIKMVEVKPEYRRLGIGIMLVKRLEQEVGKGNIDWGGLTDDGKELHDKYQQLDEMPLPVDWEEGALGADQTFKNRLQYALERAKKLGTGSARVAFTIEFEGRPTVLKVAKNNKGIAQNAAELEVLDDSYTGQMDIVIPLIDYDKKHPAPLWIQTELAKKVTAKRLAQLLHCTDVYEFFNCVYYIIHPRVKPSVPSNLEQTKQRMLASGKSEQDVELFGEYVDAVVNLLHSSTLEFGDLRQLANWGEYQGRPVIIDLGFTEETKHLYMRGR